MFSFMPLWIMAVYSLPFQPHLHPQLEPASLELVQWKNSRWSANLVPSPRSAD